MFRNRLCVPNNHALKKKLLKESHDSALTTHPGSTKMYQDLKPYYWQSGMKKDVANYVAYCLTCQRVKTEHQRSGGLLQPLPILVYKWDHITMDFIVGTPRSQKLHDGIRVIVDRLTKSAHFLKPPSMQSSWQTYILRKQYGCMGYHCQQYLTETPSLPLNFGRNSNGQWYETTAEHSFSPLN